MAEIIAFFKALPVLWEIYLKAEKAFGPDWAKKSMDIIESYGKARNATTAEEIYDAAKRIHDAWSK